VVLEVEQKLNDLAEHTFEIPLAFLVQTRDQLTLHVKDDKQRAQCRLTLEAIEPNTATKSRRPLAFTLSTA
jgi:hypothetical protein